MIGDYLEDHGLPLAQLKQRRDLIVALMGRTGRITKQQIAEIARNGHGAGEATGESDHNRAHAAPQNIGPHRAERNAATRSPASGKRPNS